MNQRKKNGLFSLKELDIIAGFLPQGLLKQMTTGMGIYISTLRDNVKYDAIITNRQKENSGCKETFQQPFLQQQMSSVELYQYSVFIAMFQAVVQLRNKTTQRNLFPTPGFHLDYLPFFSLLSYSINVISSDIVNIFQIWSTLSGKEELGRGFDPDRKIF